MSKTPLEVVGWLSTAGHQTIVNEKARKEQQAEGGKMRNIMLDIETVGTTHEAAIVSIGWCHFSYAEKNMVFNADKVNVDLQSSINHGLVVDGATVRFWMEQSREAQAALFDPKPVTLEEALDTLARQVDRDKTVVWAKPPQFDFTILANAYQKVFFQNPPWNFRNERCLRTLLHLAKQLNLTIKMEERADDKHDAKADARYQAEQAARILRLIQPLRYK